LLSNNVLVIGTFSDVIFFFFSDVFPLIFEGAKLIINKGLSSHFRVSHTVTMSSVTPSGYRFGATYVGTKQISPSEAFPVLLGDIDPSGNLNAHIIHQIGQRIKAKYVTQIQNSKFVAAQLGTEYKGNDYTLSLTAENVDIINESGISNIIEQVMFFFPDTGVFLIHVNKNKLVCLVA
jgi:mitochondrial import receptor subunit TOM40